MGSLILTFKVKANIICLLKHYFIEQILFKSIWKIETKKYRKVMNVLFK